MATVGPARRPVYVWELPVRVVHWTIVLALIVLSVTGYYIHHPFLSGSGAAGHPGFTMGLVRFIHEATGFALLAAVLFRIYWAFVRNRFAHWRALLPITAAQRRALRHMVLYYALRRRHPPRANGHNPLASMAYGRVPRVPAVDRVGPRAVRMGQPDTRRGGRCSAGPTAR